VTTPRDPLAETDRLLIDGTNLLHALAKGRGAAAGTAMPPATVIGRLRGAIPAAIGIELVFDGCPEPGMRGERVASGLVVRHAGRRSADDVLIGLVEEARHVAGPAAATGLLVVTDDQALRTSLRGLGARTAGTAWLIGRLERRSLAAPTTGNRRAPKAPATDDGDADADRRRWSPGRGATVKKGNPRRGKSRSGRMPP
jgi:hypothetical protein